LNTIDYDASTETVAFGTGLKWETLYEHLLPFERTVLGGRIYGIGVGGFTLHGGASSR